MEKSDVKWVLERDTFDEGNPEKMAEIIKAKGMSCQWIDYVPFGGMSQDPSLSKKNDDCKILYGSINFIRFALKNCNSIPMAWLNADTLRCSHYYSFWGKHIFQQNYCFITFAELKRQANSLYKNYGESDCIFIRPDNNFKTFTGKVVARDEFEHWYKQELDCYNIEPTLFVVVARPRNIKREWRFLVCKKQIITGSLYKQDGQSCVLPETDPKALEFASSVAKDSWQPDTIYVMDVAETTEGFSLLEIGGANCAGLYACDLEKVVDTFTELAIEEWNNIYGDL
jgi:hypothetical protein